MTVAHRFLIGASLASMLAATAAYAGPTSDFSTLGSNNTSIGATASLDGINISAFQTNFSTPSNLWVRSEGSTDDGLGVCSTSESCPTGGTGGGDANELSNESKLEWIVLQRPTDMMWSELWISSLDNGGNPNEQGTVYWSNTLGDLTTGHFSYTYPAFSPSNDVFGDILATAGSFDPFADFLMFRAGGDGEAVGESHNNDYLIWGATLASCPDCGTEGFPTPEPVTLSLFGAGLAGMAALRRRRKAPAQ